MNGYHKKLILVTGIPRSGTTAVGEMLALHHTVGNLHEPFNSIVGLKNIHRYFEIPGTENFSEKDLDECINNILSLKLEFRPGIFPNDHGAFKILKSIIGGRAVNSYRKCRFNPLLKIIVWKDPFACFVSEYISKVHQVQTLVTLRNPWAVAASFKRMGWSFELDELTHRIQEGFGYDFYPNLIYLKDKKDAYAINGAILWHLIYSVLDDWSNQNEKIIFVNLDDIVSAPVSLYQKLYEVLDLYWNEVIENKILKSYTKSTNSDTPKEKKAHDRNRTLDSLNTYWRNVLDQDEIKIVSQLNHDLWENLTKKCLT